MTKEVSPAWWVGQAAHEMIQLTACTGASAHVTARGLVTDLLDYGINLASVDPRDYVRELLA